jgi:hypothetical protein
VVTWLVVKIGEVVSMIILDAICYLNAPEPASVILTPEDGSRMD